MAAGSTFEAAASTTERLTMAAAISHLRQTPWCAELIDSAAWTPTRTTSRIAKPITTEDSFFAETLGTERTIRHCLTLRPKEEDLNGDVPFRKVITIMELGSGLNGHPNICHGGFVATMLDEVLGVLIQLNLEVSSRQLRAKERGHPGLSCFTACKWLFVCSAVPGGSLC